MEVCEIHNCWGNKVITSQPHYHKHDNDYPLTDYIFAVTAAEHAWQLELFNGIT